MSPALPFPIRKECPPGACVCGRADLLDTWELAPDTDIAILRLTRDQELRLIARIETISSYDELGRIARKLEEQLGVSLNIWPGPNEVRTVRGLVIQLGERPGLCKKTRQEIPAAIRRCLDRHPEIVFAILNAHDLLGSA
ncbi:hypothetical protein HSX11_15130 [Oxalobacteraceae bacterium]|nr:hypothetical protein [Oxalobacteraceae bacterium]